MKKKKLSPALFTGLIVGLLTMSIFTGFAYASPPIQSDDPPHEYTSDSECRECHLDVADNWSHSPHAHTYDDPVFQERWVGLGSPENCLACHTTNYSSSSESYDAEGVSCQACHGFATTNHPPEIVPTKADTDYCGSCHTTTISEWRSTGHAASGVGCMDCHNPHSQKWLFEDPDDLCINCHKDGMGDYLDDLHVQKDIGCVDCHALVIPPEVVPEDGIVPTGHTFNITPQTCVACHTDSLHSGLTLPGYENGAAAGYHDQNGTEEEGMAEAGEGAKPLTEPIEESEISSSQQIQALETALASSKVSNLFQGAVIGLVLGSSTAWVVGQNLRGRSDEEDE